MSGDFAMFLSAPSRSSSHARNVGSSGQARSVMSAVSTSFDTVDMLRLRTGCSNPIVAGLFGQRFLNFASALPGSSGPRRGHFRLDDHGPRPGSIGFNRQLEITGFVPAPGVEIVFDELRDPLAARVRGGDRLPRSGRRRR